MLKKLKYLTSARRAKDFLRLWPCLGFFFGLLFLIITFGALVKYPLTVDGVGLLLMRGELSQVISTHSGSIERWLKEEGDIIKKGESLALIRDYRDPSKITEIKSTLDGVIAEIVVYANSTAQMGEPLAFITSHGDPKKDLELIGFVSSLSGKMIKEGMPATVDPSFTNAFIHGTLLGTVKRVGKLPVTKASLQSILKIPEMAKYIRNRIEAEPFIVVITLKQDENHKTGYQWSGPGPSFELDSGVFADIAIMYDEPSILTMLWPSLKKLRLGAL